ncbi:MAG: hypothetical protein P8L66_03920 [Rhodospirillaceae bacterium]|nr:hypothetical protein [Rhodospirillaceae bacterium]
MGIEVGGLFGLLILIANVYAIVKIIQGTASTGTNVFSDRFDSFVAAPWVNPVVFVGSESFLNVR